MQTDNNRYDNVNENDAVYIQCVGLANMAIRQTRWVVLTIQVQQTEDTRKHINSELSRKMVKYVRNFLRYERES